MPRIPLWLHPSRIALSHPRMKIPVPSGRSIIRTALATYAVAIGGNAACDSPRDQGPPAGRVPSAPKLPAGRSRSSAATDERRPGAPLGGSNAAAAYSTMTTSQTPGMGNGKAFITSVVAFKGQRSYMEDDFFVSKDGSFAGVYDGHGGAAVSRYLRQNLHAQFLSALPDEERSKIGTDVVVRALSDAFRAVDDAVLKVRHWSYMGSTAVVVVLQWNEEEKRTNLISANIGDSRAVLSRKGKAVELTMDHKPNLPSELERVKKLGGTVRWYGLVEQDGRPMEGMGVYRINGNLAVARSVGDRSERPFVSGDVDMKTFSLEEGDQFIILATDGLWDVMSSEEAVNFVHNVMSAHVGALREGGDSDEGTERPMEMNISDWSEQYMGDRNIIRAALLARKRKMARYLSEEAFRRGTMDNVTVVVIWI